MKKCSSLLLFVLMFSPLFSLPHKTVHSESSDYTLLPSCEFAQNYSKKLKNSFPVRTCYEDYSRIPKSDFNGKQPSEILHNLSMMGGQVRYFDIPKQKFVPIFRECSFNETKNELYIRDKNFGKMYCSTELYEDSQNCAVLATLSKPLANILFWEIKKNEFSIFVMTNETEEFIELYILIQTSYKINKLFRGHIENAFAARINGMQDWFVRMYTLPELD